MAINGVHCRSFLSPQRPLLSPLPSIKSVEPEPPSPSPSSLSKPFRARHREARRRTVRHAGARPRSRPCPLLCLSDRATLKTAVRTHRRSYVVRHRVVPSHPAGARPRSHPRPLPRPSDRATLETAVRTHRRSYAVRHRAVPSHPVGAPPNAKTSPSLGRALPHRDRIPPFITRLKTTQIFLLTPKSQFELFHEFGNYLLCFGIL
jgi:hypothetical protein